MVFFFFFVLFSESKRLLVNVVWWTIKVKPCHKQIPLKSALRVTFGKQKDCNNVHHWSRKWKHAFKLIHYVALPVHCHKRRGVVGIETEHGSRYGWLCRRLLAKLLSPCDRCLKSQQSAWHHCNCVHPIDLFISPCRHFGRSGDGGHHCGKACWDTWSVSQTPADSRVTVFVATAHWQLLGDQLPGH